MQELDGEHRPGGPPCGEGRVACQAREECGKDEVEAAAHAQRGEELGDVVEHRGLGGAGDCEGEAHERLRPACRAGLLCGRARPGAAARTTIGALINRFLTKLL